MSERRRIMMNQSSGGGLEYIDLGLPSGTLWARGNIVPDGNGGYKVGNETDFGAHFSWGNVTPHFSSNGSTFDDGYNFSESVYEDTPGSYLYVGMFNDPEDYCLPGGSYDAAHVCLGGDWKVPTYCQFQELISYTSKEEVTINGVKGMKFKKSSDPSVYVFFPYAGYGDGTSCYGRNSSCIYWSSSLTPDDFGYEITAYKNHKGASAYMDSLVRHSGLPVRAVQ